MLNTKELNQGYMDSQDGSPLREVFYSNSATPAVYTMDSRVNALIYIGRLDINNFIHTDGWYVGYLTTIKN